MDPADFQTLQELVGAIIDCLDQGAGPWEKLGVANEVLDFFLQRPVHRLSGLAEIWKEAKRVHHAAMVEIFELGPLHLPLQPSCPLPLQHHSPQRHSLQPH